jgi:hypothetical protein
VVLILPMYTTICLRVRTAQGRNTLHHAQDKHQAAMI